MLNIKQYLQCADNDKKEKVMTDTEKYAERKTKSDAASKLKEWLQVCPHIVPPNIGIEAYLKEFDNGVKWILDNNYTEHYKPAKTI